MEENILFLRSVYGFNGMIDNFEKFPSDARMEQINKSITSIYNLYVKVGAEKELNVSYGCRQEAKSHMHENAFKTYPLEQKKKLFERCAAEIEHLIQISVLDMFLKSDPSADAKCAQIMRSMPKKPVRPSPESLKITSLKSLQSISR